METRKWLERRVRSRLPPLDKNRMVGREDGAVSINKLCNNKLRSLGPEWSMYEVGTSPPQSSEKPHRMVASNKHTCPNLPCRYPAPPVGG